MKIDDIQMTVLKSCWMKLATMGQALGAVNIDSKMEAITVRNLGFCLGDISSQMNEILIEIVEGQNNEKCSSEIS